MEAVGYLNGCHEAITLPHLLLRMDTVGKRHGAGEHELRILSLGHCQKLILSHSKGRLGSCETYPLVNLGWLWSLSLWNELVNWVLPIICPVRDLLHDLICFFEELCRLESELWHVLAVFNYLFVQHLGVWVFSLSAFPFGLELDSAFRFRFDVGFGLFEMTLVWRPMHVQDTLVAPIDTLGLCKSKFTSLQRLLNLQEVLLLFVLGNNLAWNYFRSLKGK